jgi:hypothetical protein
MEKKRERGKEKCATGEKLKEKKFMSMIWNWLCALADV